MGHRNGCCSVMSENSLPLGSPLGLSSEDELRLLQTGTVPLTAVPSSSLSLDRTRQITRKPVRQALEPPVVPEWDPTGPTHPEVRLLWGVVRIDADAVPSLGACRWRRPRRA